MMLDRDLSARIQLCRFLCVFFMMFVHVPLEQTASLGGDGGSLFNLGRVVLDTLGRASVPLLSTLSGYLAYTSLSGGKPFKVFLNNRFTTLMFPMLFWSSVTVFLAVATELWLQPTWLSRGIEASTSPLLYLLNSLAFLTAIDREAQTVPLAFLRDLFVCALLAPVMIYLLRRVPSLVLAILFFLYLLDLRNAVTLRPLIFFCYALGIWLAMYRLNLRSGDRLRTVFGLALAISVAIYIFCLTGFQAGWLPSSLDLELLIFPLIRMFSAVYFWTLTASLLNTRAGDAMKQWSALAYLAYCMHTVFLAAIYAVFWKPALGESFLSGQVFFVIAPALVLVVSALMVKLLRRCAPWVGQVVAGMRFGAWPAGAGAASSEKIASVVSDSKRGSHVVAK